MLKKGFEVVEYCDVPLCFPEDNHRMALLISHVQKNLCTNNDPFQVHTEVRALNLALQHTTEA